MIFHKPTLCSGTERCRLRCVQSRQALILANCLILASRALGSAATLSNLKVGLGSRTSGRTSHSEGSARSNFVGAKLSSSAPSFSHIRLPSNRSGASSRVSSARVRGVRWLCQGKSVRPQWIGVRVLLCGDGGDCPPSAIVHILIASRNF